MNLKAFTLVETLIAVAVIALAIVGPFQIAQGVLETSYTARDQLTATALAQEGVEYVRKVRDNNYIYNLHTPANRAWLYGLDTCYTYACVVDPGQQTVTSCGNQTCSTKPLYLSSSNLYTQVTTNGTQTRFTRAVKLTQISATETKVTVTVSWNYHGARSVVLTEIMDDWL
ncbi:MAG: type IV pilus modification PilV family protein [Bacillota bacterium]